MFKINYTISNSEREKKSLEVNDTTLRYYSFQGSVLLKYNNSKINLDWGWIPLLDFAYTLLLICEDLLSEEFSREEFEFTESDGVLYFIRKENSVEISTSFSNEILIMSIVSFQKGVSYFYYELITQVKKINKEITNNPNFKVFDDKLHNLNI
ncbi:hypothetical protein [Mesonia sp. K7]|uniref:hypothetical protein n=1 Tax=Mesonia sp. K7 TaxID=2218606 RepID=UPI000DA758A9|nr:hypothetical protein [Mesonia sp. K7]PZD77378.1 hypothetical protein DNG35_08650 [Mesonia sp. K7]